MQYSDSPVSLEKERLFDFLKRIELFKGCNDQDFEGLAEHIQQRIYQTGSFLFEEQKPREGIFFIYDGEVELFKKTPRGAEKKLAQFRVYDFLGEGSLLDDDPHSTTARALTATTVLLLDKDFFNHNAPITVKIFSQIARVISRRMHHTNNRIINTAAQYVSGQTRLEHDLLGEKEVPGEYYFGIQTLRALENFNISGITLNFYPELIKSLVMIKKAACLANYELGYLDEKLKKSIVAACDDIISGRYHVHFVVDMIQGGAGTSTNMNANEVIANRALEIMGYEKGEYEHCHPNTHVNHAQSTNDVYPSAIKIAMIYSNFKLVSVLQELIHAFRKKAAEFSDILKIGRTQLQDAVPMTLGQTFEAYAASFEDEIDRLKENADMLLTLNLGGTAIGTGINTDPEYADRAIRHLRSITGLDLKKSDNLVKSTQHTGAFIMYSSALKRLSVQLSKICSDLRLLSSGPRAGLHEINLPKVQPGSSIMPGKVNPVIPEVVNQIAFKVIGNDLTVTLASEAGQLELNAMEPVIVQSIFESVEMLKNGMITLIYKCILGITANKEHCRHQVENSIGLVTALNPVLGYETCSNLAKEALEKNESIYNLVIQKGLLSQDKLDSILLPDNMLGPNKIK